MAYLQESREVFNKWHWNNWISTCKKINLDTDLTPFVKINSKRIRDINVKCKTINLLEDNGGESLDYLGFDNDFLNTTLKAQYMKERMDKLDFIKIKNFCSVRHC